MASLAQSIRSFRSGQLSREELFAEVDRILTAGRADETWLLQSLAEENTRTPLPSDIHDAVKQRIEFSAQNKQEHESGKEEADVEYGGFVDPDQSRTLLATSVFNEVRSSTSENQASVSDLSTAAGAKSGMPPLMKPERTKGTGDVLNNRFVLENCIGSGGMSTVYKAQDRRKLEAHDRNPYVAVKVLNVEFRSHPDSLIALQREAKKSQTLAHPNIVRVYDFDRDGPTVYMTMEYLSGTSLVQKLRAPGFIGLPREEAIHILDGIANALIFAHDNGIVHADLKPANIIITDTGQVKVIDFGIARAFQRPDETDKEATRFDPGSLGALTPTYASPEMIEHCQPDPRDDIYALACIAYEMCTGRHPFGRMQATEARDGGLVLERRKNQGRRQWKAFKSALAFERDKRTPTVRQFMSELKCERTLPVPYPLLAGGLVAMLLIAGAGAYFYTNPDVRRALFGGTPHQLAVVPRPELTGQKPSSPAIRPPVVSSPGSASTSSTGMAVPARGKPTEAPVPPVAPTAQKSPGLSLAAVMAVVERLPCAALETSVTDGAVRLRGYVSLRLDIKDLKRELLGLPGAREISTDLRQVSEEKCKVLDVYAPYWTINHHKEEGTSIRTANGTAEFSEGDPLIVKITTPPYDTYVNIDYYSLDGRVVHMLPSPGAQGNQAPANYSATLGDLGEWIIAEPFGTEMVTVLVTPRPLFTTSRDEHESGSEYLAAVEAQLALMAKESGKDRLTADFVLISTKPKSPHDRIRETPQKSE